MKVEHNTDAVALVVFTVLFLLVTGLGFIAARWRRGDLGQLHEWGLGGRRFGTIVTWFLLGGDLYTAYTFIEVPALVFGVGAQGFFALPYTIIVYPLVFIAVPRLWVVAHRRGYVTPADFVRGRFGSRPMATAVAATGLLATMPTSRCSSSASRWCSAPWASAATGRGSSPSPSSPPTPTRAACARRR
jgi:SSS family solute:Na+ symporter